MRISFFFVLTLFLSGCSLPKPLNKAELAQMPNHLGELKLAVAYETNELRLDIIRQTYEITSGESNAEVKKVDYHPLGFDLGNGLFYDLNKNLSLRIDKLFSIGASEDFVIEQIDFIGKSKGKKAYKSRKSDEYCNQWTGKLGQQKAYCTQNQSSDNMTKLFHKNKLLYQIAGEQDEIIFTRGQKNRPKSIIKRKSSNKYQIGNKKKKREYTLHNNEILLGKDYLVRKESEDNSISIYHKFPKKNILIFKIKKSEDKIFVYDKKYYGKRIEFNASKIMLYNHRQRTELRRIN